jgi:Plus-3 domain
VDSGDVAAPAAADGCGAGARAMDVDVETRRDGGAAAATAVEGASASFGQLRVAGDADAGGEAAGARKSAGVSRAPEAAAPSVAAPPPPPPPPVTSGNAEPSEPEVTQLPPAAAGGDQRQSRFFALTVDEVPSGFYAAPRVAAEAPARAAAAAAKSPGPARPSPERVCVDGRGAAVERPAEPQVAWFDLEGDDRRAPSLASSAAAAVLSNTSATATASELVAASPVDATGLSSSGHGEVEDANPSIMAATHAADGNVSRREAGALSSPAAAKTPESACPTHAEAARLEEGDVVMERRAAPSRDVFVDLESDAPPVPVSAPSTLVAGISKTTVAETDDGETTPAIDITGSVSGYGAAGLNRAVVPADGNVATVTPAPCRSDGQVVARASTKLPNTGDAARATLSTPAGLAVPGNGGEYCVASVNGASSGPFAANWAAQVYRGSVSLGANASETAVPFSHPEPSTLTTGNLASASLAVWIQPWHESALPQNAAVPHAKRTPYSKADVSFADLVTARATLHARPSSNATHLFLSRRIIGEHVNEVYFDEAVRGLFVRLAWPRTDACRGTARDHALAQVASVSAKESYEFQGETHGSRIVTNKRLLVQTSPGILEEHLMSSFSSDPPTRNDFKAYRKEFCHCLPQKKVVEELTLKAKAALPMKAMASTLSPRVASQIMLFGTSSNAQVGVVSPRPLGQQAVAHSLSLPTPSPAPQEVAIAQRREPRPQQEALAASYSPGMNANVPFSSLPNPAPQVGAGNARSAAPPPQGGHVLRDTPPANGDIVAKGGGSPQPESSLPDSPQPESEDHITVVQQFLGESAIALSQRTRPVVRPEPEIVDLDAIGDDQQIKPEDGAAAPSSDRAGQPLQSGLNEGWDSDIEIVSEHIVSKF